jgi:hypothetical protein
LNVKAKVESNTSYFSSKCLIPGGFNTGFTGSTCTALPRLARRAARASTSAARAVAVAAAGATPWMMVCSDATEAATDVNPALMPSPSAVDSWCACSAAMDAACTTLTAAREASRDAEDACRSVSFASCSSSAV